MNTYERARKKVSEIIGRPLKHEEEVHHVDENPYNNSNSNLVLCPSREYHQLLHIRMRAREECGDVNKRKCGECKEYSFPADMRVERVNSYDGKNTVRYFHPACLKKRSARKKLAAKVRRVA